MKITSIRTHQVQVSRERSWLFVEIFTDQGFVGLGEASQSRNDAGVVAEIVRLLPQYVGEDPLDLIERRQAQLAWPYVGRTLFAAVSALEQGLWDLCGKRLGVPVYQLLGGRVRERVRAYANIGYAATSTSPEALAEAARRAVSEGFDALKLYPLGMRPAGGPDATTERRWLREGEGRVRAVREAVGPDVDILADLMHQLSDLSEATHFARQLDACNLFWIEDPFPRDDPRQLAEFRQRIGPRLAGGAPHLTRHEFRPLLEGAALDVIMPDVKWIGGIGEAKKAAAMAEVYGVFASPHSASGPVSSAASVHLALSLSNFLILEHAWGLPLWRDALCRGTERLERGHFLVSSMPGLGIDLDTAVAAKHREVSDTTTSQGVRLPLD